MLSLSLSIHAYIYIYIYIYIYRRRSCPASERVPGADAMLDMRARRRGSPSHELDMGLVGL